MSNLSLFRLEGQPDRATLASKAIQINPQNLLGGRREPTLGGCHVTSTQYYTLTHK